MLAVILMVMMCAVSPARKVSAEVLNSPQQIVWGQSYSGELEDAQNTYEYTFLRLRRRKLERHTPGLII